ncbi:ATP-dependent DNA helicase homolog RECG, chloroplastic isoform X2 [Malania oleifera]|uniref:ATP-dependent DNA helicase homolog RECG, chloroplastic isoform X2 n=1 Tax=Malania oleifera TaxID=397392 RepID=UPI0025ADE069|nr:ATP-dependent DNA helicase homolog RECG, chloroplastic isoform X2 [Malania oleifera]
MSREMSPTLSKHSSKDFTSIWNGRFNIAYSKRLHSTWFCEKSLRSALAYEAMRSYPNALGRKMRFSSFLLARISKLCSRSKHKFAENGKGRISDRSELLNKVSVLMCYNCLDELINNGRASKESDINLKEEMDDSDVSLACRRFPSIILGGSSLVELYDGATSWSEISHILATKWVDPDSLCETWHPLYPTHRHVHSSSFGESTPQPLNVKNDINPDLLVMTGEDSTMRLESKQNAASFELPLDKSISCIPGLSKRQCSQLEKCGFHTLRKLLQHFPRTYADLQNVQVGIVDGQYMIFFGKILSSRGIKTSCCFAFLEVVVGCEIGDSEVTSERMIEDVDGQGKKRIYLHLKKFFRGTRFTSKPFLKCLQEKQKEGDNVIVCGKVRTMNMKDHYEIREYNLDVIEDGRNSSVCAKERLYPIYPSKRGVKPNFLQDMISRVLQALPINVDPIPKAITQDFGLLRLHDAYIRIHQPEDLNEADLARKRLIFDEFFYLQLGRLFQMLEGLRTQIEKDGLLDKYRKRRLNAVFSEEWSSLTKTFLKALPYSLTSSQLTAVSEIIWDLKWPVPMNRLLQGDVGCGKTVVAFLACMEVIGSGYQAAFMVPTELLAVQHYEKLLNLLEGMKEVQCKPSVALLTGSTPSKQSQIIRKGLQTGHISLVIGTHSLIAENVEFSALRIAVVDEQHRFGVIQRGKFNSKLYNTSLSSRMSMANSDASSKGAGYMAPHVLALSATPIPRTLALALYGDMSLTQITDLPPGRIPVETYIFEQNEAGFENVFQMMLDDLGTGGKVYLVYPIIEKSEQLPQLRAASTDFVEISQRFMGHSCGLLHGKMKSDEKDEALRQFRCGETRILLSTHVVEVGVDVPDASMMVVMNAERFGIAQLHQLRGRVGRGIKKSKCILLAAANSLNRLKVLQSSTDGFYLANIDLLLRGPGDLLGKKQSGHLPEFPIARLEMDGNILEDAYIAALKILDASHDLEQFPGLKAELSMRQPLCLLGD